MAASRSGSHRPLQAEGSVMTDPFSIKVNDRELAQALNRAPVRLAAELKNGWRAAKDNFQALHTRNQMNGRPGLNRVTGRLSNSFGGDVTGNSLSNLKLIYGTNLIYAPTHEFGRGPIPPRLRLMRTWDEHTERFGGLIDQTNAAIDRTLKTI